VRCKVPDVLDLAPGQPASAQQQGVDRQYDGRVDAAAGQTEDLGPSWENVR
jgi:hypothetical protein